MRILSVHFAGECDTAAEQLAIAPAHVCHERAAQKGHSLGGSHAASVSARQDLMKIDPDRARDVRVTLVEAMQVISTNTEREHARTQP